jgi:hypothetical protein
MLSAFSKHRAEPFRRATRLQSSGCIVGSTDPVGVTPPEPRAPCAARCTNVGEGKRRARAVGMRRLATGVRPTQPTSTSANESRRPSPGEERRRCVQCGRALAGQAQRRRVHSAFARSAERSFEGRAAPPRVARHHAHAMASDGARLRASVRAAMLWVHSARAIYRALVRARAAASSLTSRRRASAGPLPPPARERQRRSAISSGGSGGPGCGCTAHARSADARLRAGRRRASPRDERARRPLPPARERQRRSAISSGGSGERAGTLWTCGRRLRATGGMRGAQTLGFSSGDVCPSARSVALCADLSSEIRRIWIAFRVRQKSAKMCLRDRSAMATVRAWVGR